MKPPHSILTFVTFSTGLSSLAFSLLVASAVQAAPLKFTPTGSQNVGEIVCTTAVQKVGRYYPPAGSVSIKGDVIKIQATHGFEDEASDVLLGEVFDTECDTSHTPLTVTGLAYFDQGTALDTMDKPDGDELVFAKQGSVRGSIQQINKSYIVVQKKDGTLSQIDRNLVILIRSPRAFRFTMLASVNGALKLPIQADVQSIDFKPTLVKTPLPSGSVIPHPIDDDDDDL
jgi:hypothetical protein